MDNSLEIFASSDFGELRTVNKDGKIMFVASDVAKMLGYKNISDAVSKHCRYIAKHDIPHPQGKGTLEVNIVSEGDVYRLITHSKLPSAEKFEHWVFDDVLPSIRRTGSYTVKPLTEYQSERLAIQKENARGRTASLWLKIASNTGIATYKEICNAYAANTLAGKEVFALPQVTEKTYTATEVGEQLGISAHKVGTIAKQNNLKTELYGKWFYDKSRYSGKQVETFRYNETGIEAIRAKLNTSEASGKIIGYEDCIDENGNIGKIALVRK